MNHTDPPKAACYGMSWLFDSTEQADYLVAREICRECPVLDACEQLLRDELRNSTAGRSGGPRGTWAGRLVGEDFRWSALPREHGTNRGYDQHRYRREDICDPCRIAHARHERDRKTGRLAS